MTDTWHLDDLPCEVLLIIFDYCNAFDLVRLSEVCKRFYEIVRTDSLWISKSKTLLITNETSERFRKRCNMILPLYKKLLVSNNWQYGRYERKTIFSHKTNLMPWLQLTNDLIWWSGGDQLCNFQRAQQFEVENKCNTKSHYNRIFAENDITKFVLWDKFIISGHRGGHINCWIERPGWKKLNQILPVKKLVATQCCDINAIDATSQSIVSGSDCGIVQMQKNILTDENVFEKRVPNISQLHHTKNKVLSLAIDPTKTKVAVGTTALNHQYMSLYMIDMDCYRVCNPYHHRWERGAGILDMVWDDPHTLLTCGYDTHIRKWDVRSGICVSSWADPTDATVYCISSDYRYSIVTGTQYNSLAVLWDQRKNDFVQLYYINSQSTHPSSPIYSLQFDSSHLYCATDRYLIKLDFSDHLCKKLDYKHYFPMRIWRK